VADNGQKGKCQGQQGLMNQRAAIYIKMPAPQLWHCQGKWLGFISGHPRKEY
jgi:hypothetical protein